jgi:hypothetical protein
MGLQEKINEVNAARKELDEKAKNILMDAFKEVFQQVPEINTIGWLQYTPYFNDGSPCVFRLRGEGVNFRLSEVPEDAEEDEDNYGFEQSGWFSEYSLKDQKISITSKHLLKDLAKAISSNIDDLESLGEGRVIVTNRGIEVEEWDHD